MRLSVKKEDPGYHRTAHRYRAFLNGAKVDHCFTADEEMGILWRYKTDQNGKVLLDETKTELLIDQLFGQVELRLYKETR